MALLHHRALVVRQETRADGSFGLENQVAGLEPRPTEGQAQDLSQFLDQVNVQGLPDFVREVIETQGAVDHLEVGSRTLTGRANRVAVGNDGDYFSKPSRDDIFEAVYAIMRERRPSDFPEITPRGRS